MKHFVLSLLTCSLSMTVIALLFRLICRQWFPSRFMQIKSFESGMGLK